MESEHRFLAQSPGSLRRFLIEHLPQFSRHALRQAAAEGQCRVDGEMRPASYRLRPGQLVEVDLAPEPQRTVFPEPLPLAVLYEDSELIVIDKPSGMLVHPTVRERSGTVANALLHRWSGGRPTFPHRLDRDTSGALVVARTAAAATSIALQFAHRRVTKEYRAVLAGRLAEARRVDAPIGRLAGDTPPWQIRADGRPAVSEIRPLATGAAATLAALVPETGRTNQLRIHAASIGHPIAGDLAYGGPPAPRLLLHAWRLGFRHPSTGGWLELTAPLPTLFSLTEL